MENGNLRTDFYYSQTEFVFQNLFFSFADPLALLKYLERAFTDPFLYLTIWDETQLAKLWRSNWSRWTNWLMIELPFIWLFYLNSWNPNQSSQQNRLNCVRTKSERLKSIERDRKDFGIDWWWWKKSKYIDFLIAVSNP